MEHSNGEIKNKSVSKFVLVFERLKKIKQKAFNNNDNETIEDVEWIMQNVNDDDFTEPQYKLETLGEINNSLIDKPKDTYSFLLKYSNHETMKRRESDLKLLKTKNNFYKNSFIIFEKPDAYMRGQSKKKSLISSFISPSICAKVSSQLSLIETYQFNIFDLNQLLDRATLMTMANEIFSRRNFIGELVNEEKLKNFLEEIVNGYNRKVPYHNDLHAGDVFQTLNLIFNESQIQLKLDLTNFDVYAMLIAAICHDFKHDGYTNDFHVNFKTDIATCYNETFKVLKNPKNNIFEDLKSEEYRIIRKRIIEGILHTDMHSHSKHLLRLKNKLESLNINKGKNLNKFIEGENMNIIFDNQQQVLGFTLHSCDISTASKESKICLEWRDLLFKEFFHQGDIEKKHGFTPSMLCDRVTTKIHESQIGFISFLVKPTFELLLDIFPEIYTLMSNIKKNLRMFQKLAAEEENFITE